MKITNFACIAIISCLFNQTALAKNNPITYKNGRNSMLTLQFNTDNSLTGSFTNAVASKACPQSVGVKRPIQGYTAENTITIIVNYPDCATVVTFIGSLKNDKKIIDTTALVAYQTSKDNFASLMLTHDVFKVLSKSNSF